jgi:hypothetical protein
VSKLLSRFAKWLVERGARALAEDRERYAEQWLADLADRPTPWAKLWFAFGVWHSSGRLRFVLEKARVEGLFTDEGDDAAMSPTRVAAKWTLRIEDSSGLSAEERARLMQWLKQSPTHLYELLWSMELSKRLRSKEMRSFIRALKDSRRGDPHHE